MDKLIEYKRKKKIGLLINSGSQMFSNGIVQNAYFIMETFHHLGIQTTLLTKEETGVLDYKDIPIKKISINPLEFDVSEYHTIITITRSVHKELYDYLVSNKVAVVAFVCGNTLMHAQEEYIRGSHDGYTTFIGKKAYIDEAWVIPSYHHSLDYIETVRGVPAYIVPHLWSPEILLANAKALFKIEESQLLYNLAIHTGKKIQIIIIYYLCQSLWD